MSNPSKLLVVGLALACGGPGKYGVIVMWRETGTPSGPFSVLPPGFYQGTDPGPESLLSIPSFAVSATATIGPCTVYTPATTMPPSPQVKGLTPGSLTVSGSPSGAMLSLDNLTAVGTVSLQEGDTVTVTGTAGPDVPAFSLSTPLPSLITLSNPNPVNLTVNRSSDLVLTHSTDASAQFVFQVAQDPSPASRVILVCSYEASVATATVPVAALSHLVADNGHTEITYGFTTTATTQAGDVAVTLYLRDYTIDSLVAVQ